MVIAYFFGTTQITDIYYNASGFVDSIASIILASLAIGVVNIYIANKEKGTNNRFVSNLAIIIVFLMIIIGVVTFVISDQISYWLAPGYTLNEHEQLKYMVQIMCIAFPFQGIVSVYSSVLQAEKNFIPVRLTGTVTSVASIFSVIIFAKNVGINSLVISYIFAIIFNALFLFLCSNKYFKFKPKGVLRDFDVKRMVILIVPLLLGTAGHEINLIIDKSIASRVTQGAISALSYSCVLYLFIENVIINSIVTAFFPNLTEMENQGKDQEVASSTRKMIILALSMLVPIMCCVYFNSVNITRIVYMRGSFDETSLSLTSAALMGYIIGLPFLAMRDIITRVYYAYDDTKFPVIVNLLSVLLNIGLDLVLYKPLGVFGITFATSVSNIFSAVVLFIMIGKYNKNINDKGGWIILIKIVVSAAPICMINSFLCTKLSGIIAFIVCTMISFSIEVIFLLIFKIVSIEQIKDIIASIKH